MRTDSTTGFLAGLSAAAAHLANRREPGTHVVRDAYLTASSSRCANLGACLSIPREPRWLCKGADARRAARAVVDSTDKPRNTADAPSRANPSGAVGFAFIRRCRLL